MTNDTREKFIEETRERINIRLKNLSSLSTLMCKTSEQDIKDIQYNYALLFMDVSAYVTVSNGTNIQATKTDFESLTEIDSKMHIAIRLLSFCVKHLTKEDEEEIEYLDEIFKCILRKIKFLLKLCDIRYSLNAAGYEFETTNESTE